MIKKVKYLKSYEITRDNVCDSMDEMISKIPQGITHQELFFGVPPKILSFFDDSKISGLENYRGIDLYGLSGGEDENYIFLGQKKDLFK